MFLKHGEALWPELVFNVGGNFATAPPLPFAVYGVEQAMSATFDDGVHRIWQVTTDLVDLDNDGYAEGGYWIGGQLHRARHDIETTGGPLRLLKFVNNGRGAVTSIYYASMHDSNAIDPVVEQNPDELWAPGRPKASPRHQWVVKSTRTGDLFAQTDATTSYRYKNPRFGPDDESRFAFRGFEQVTTIAPSGRRTIQRYSFDPDWSGRLETTLVVPGEALPPQNPNDPPTEVRSIDKTTWEARTLPGTSITTYHATRSEHFTCANGQDEASCTTSAPGYTRTDSTLVAFPVAGPTLLWQEDRIPAREARRHRRRRSRNDPHLRARRRRPDISPAPAYHDEEPPRRRQHDPVREVGSDVGLDAAVQAHRRDLVRRRKEQGGTVVRKPEPTRSGKMNDKHVDICLGPGKCPFGDIQPNPVPKKDRVD